MGSKTALAEGSVKGNRKKTMFTGSDDSPCTVFSLNIFLTVTVMWPVRGGWAIIY